MPELKMIVMGDIHLERLIWRKHRQVIDDSLVSFRSLVDHAIRLKVPLVLVGDIFDSIEPEPFLVEFFRHEMERCELADIKVYAIQGNHDKRPVPWYVAISSWPIHFGDGHPILINGLGCLGFDYASKDVIEGQLQALQASLCDPSGKQVSSGPQVLFLHQAVRQALRFDGAWNCDLDWVPDGIPLTILGDIHKYQEMTMRNGGRGFYTGATHPRSIEEIGSKTCMGIMDDLSVTTFPLVTRCVEKITLAGEIDPSQFGTEFIKHWHCAAAISNPALPAVAWLRYSQEHALVANAVREQLKSIPTLIVIDDPLVMRESEDEAVAAATTDLPPLSVLMARCVDPEKEPFAYQLCMGLMEPLADLQERIRDQRDRFIVQPVTQAQ